MTTEAHNPSRDQLDLRKVLAEIDNLMAEARRKEEERAETLKLQVEAQTFKLRHALAAVIGTVVFLAALKALLPFL